MIRGNNINRFLRGCSDHRDQLFCLFELKKASLALRMESRLEKIFSMGINIMSLAVWLVEDRKCSAAVVGLDLEKIEKNENGANLNLPQPQNISCPEHPRRNLLILLPLIMLFHYFFSLYLSLVYTVNYFYLLPVITQHAT